MNTGYIPELKTSDVSCISPESTLAIVTLSMTEIFHVNLVNGEQHPQLQESSIKCWALTFSFTLPTFTAFVSRKKQEDGFWAIKIGWRFCRHMGTSCRASDITSYTCAFLVALFNKTWRNPLQITEPFTLIRTHRSCSLRREIDLKNRMKEQINNFWRTKEFSPYLHVVSGQQWGAREMNDVSTFHSKHPLRSGPIWFGQRMVSQWTVRDGRQSHTAWHSS